MNTEERIRFLKERVRRLSEIGIALSVEKDTDRLFEMILNEAKMITRADGRTLYMKNKDGDLQFEILQNDTMLFLQQAHRASDLSGSRPCLGQLRLFF